MRDPDPRQQAEATSQCNVAMCVPSVREELEKLAASYEHRARCLRELLDAIPLKMPRRAESAISDLIFQATRNG